MKRLHLARADVQLVKASAEDLCDMQYSLAQPFLGDPHSLMSRRLWNSCIRLVQMADADCMLVSAKLPRRRERRWQIRELRARGQGVDQHARRGPRHWRFLGRMASPYALAPIKREPDFFVF